MIHLKLSLEVGKFKEPALEALEKLPTRRWCAFVLIDSWDESLARWHKEHTVRRLEALNDLQLVHEKRNIALQMLLLHLKVNVMLCKKHANKKHQNLEITESHRRPALHTDTDTTKRILQDFWSSNIIKISHGKYTNYFRALISLFF